MLHASLRSSPACKPAAGARASSSRHMMLFRHGGPVSTLSSSSSSRRANLCGRTAALPVLAFKDSEKAELLKTAARDFIDCWANGCRTSGPSDQQFIKDLSELVSRDIKVQAVHPLGNIEFQGLEGLVKKLALDANFKSSMRPSRMLLSACDEEAHSVFCLLECEEMGSMDEDVNLVLLELHCMGRTYGIVKLDIDVGEDGHARVKGITERMQLGPADACLLAMLYPDHNDHHTDGAEHKDAAGKVALKMAATWGFPREDIRAKPLKGEALEAAKRNIQIWCDARSSGNDAGALLKSITHEGGFSLWDPYGVLPTVCGVRDAAGACTYKGVEADSYVNCIIPMEAVVNRLAALKENYLIKCDLIDSAMSSVHNVGFSYWHSSMKHIIHTKAGVHVDHEHDWPIEAMAVHLFHHDGKIKDTWMLRDPYEIEKQMMDSICTIGKL